MAKLNAKIRQIPDMDGGEPVDPGQLELEIDSAEINAAVTGITQAIPVKSANDKTQVLHFTNGILTAYKPNE